MSKTFTAQEIDSVRDIIKDVIGDMPNAETRTLRSLARSPHEPLRVAALSVLRRREKAERRSRRAAR